MAKCTYTKEDVIRAAMKYTTLRDFIGCDRKSYNKARRMGWLKEMHWLKRERRAFTPEYLESVAGRYDSLAEFYSNAFCEYRAALHKGIIGDFTWLSRHIPSTNWEYVTSLAVQHDGMKTFKTLYPDIYMSAVRHRWLDRLELLFRGDAGDDAGDDAVPKTDPKDYTECYARYEKLIQDECAARERESRRRPKPEPDPEPDPDVLYELVYGPKKPEPEPEPDHVPEPEPDADVLYELVYGPKKPEPDPEPEPIPEPEPDAPAGASADVEAPVPEDAAAEQMQAPEIPGATPEYSQSMGELFTTIFSEEEAEKRMKARKSETTLFREAVMEMNLSTDALLNSMNECVDMPVIAMDDFFQAPDAQEYEIYDECDY